MIQEKPLIDPDGKYSVMRAAELLGMHRCTLWRYVKRGKLRPYNCDANSRTRFRGKDLLRLWEKEL